MSLCDDCIERLKEHLDFCLRHDWDGAFVIIGGDWDAAHRRQCPQALFHWVIEPLEDEDDPDESDSVGV